MFFPFLFFFLMEYLLCIIKVRDVKSEKIYRDIIIFASFFCCNSNNEYLKRKITNQFTVIFLITLYRYKISVISCDNEQVTIHYVFLHLLNSWSKNFYPFYSLDWWWITDDDNDVDFISDGDNGTSLLILILLISEWYHNRLWWELFVLVFFFLLISCL